MPREKDLKRVVRRRMATTGERYTQARAAIRSAPTQRITAMRQQCPDARGGDLVEVEIPVTGGVRLVLDSGLYLVVLKQRDRERWLSIFIGNTEANAIAVALMGRTLERPLTADLMVASIRALGGEVERVVITRVESSCFFGEVHVRAGAAPAAVLDARPSDALGAAVRTGAPIFVASGVMEAAGSASDTPPVNDVRVQVGAAEAANTIAYEPAVAPTHVLIDVATEREVTRLSVPGGVFPQPGSGTVLDLRTEEGDRSYRVVSVESGTEGLIRLRAEEVPEQAG